MQKLRYLQTVKVPQQFLVFVSLLQIAQNLD